MHRALFALTLIACGSKDSGPPAARGRSDTAAPARTPAEATPGDAPAAEPEAKPEARAERDDASEIAKMVVRDVGSKALGGQTIDPACVTVNVLTAGDWTVASAWLKDCGDKTARSILWLYKRQSGPWNEDYVGQPPKCWKGVPADIAPAVATVTKIPTC